MKYCLLLLVFLTGIASAQTRSKNASARYQFPDIMELRSHITDTADRSNICFSDLGAWHAYGLPKQPECWGGFTGPLIMDADGRWLANSAAQLQVKEEETPIDLSAATASFHYYPGLLQAKYYTKQLEIVQQLIFTSGRKAAIRTTIRNLTDRKRKLQLAYTGKLLLSNARLHATERGLTVNLEMGKLFCIDYDRKPLSVTVGDRSYTSAFPPMPLKPGGSISIVQSHDYYPEGYPGHSSGSAVSAMPLSAVFENALAAGDKRWNTYIANVLPGIVKAKAFYGGDRQACERLAVKCLLTLVSNYRSPAKDLLHAGVFPSVSGFYAMWSWDSWKQAVALAYFNPGMAKDNIRCLFDYQDSAGMVPDCVFTERSKNNLRDTKPPLAAWAVWEVYRRTKDREFLVEMYPRLVKYHRWWYAYRDNDKNSLCEFGATDGTRIAAAWESGMDNAVRFDSARMIHSGGNAWSLNQESVDLNAYLYAEKLFLGKMASVLGKQSNKWEDEAEILKEKIERRFYSQDKGYYYDYHVGAAHLMLTEGPEGWIPLWAGIPQQDRASRVRDMMMDTVKFNTYLPLPTLSADHPAFNPANGYWRGPVWLDQFYFGVRALQRYGYHHAADSLLLKFFQHTEGLWDKGAIRENYHPLTGKGLNAMNFSWSAAMILLLLCENGRS